MNSNDRNGASETDDPGQPGVIRPQPAILKDEIRRRESAVIDDEAAVLIREKLASTREDAAHLREGAALAREGEAHLREEAATTREQEIRAVESTQAASDIHMSMLQQANARLITAAIEARQLAEQIEATRAELVRARVAAEKANLAKSDFLSSMSHELRSPLNAILGFAQLMETSTPPPTDIQHGRLQQIIKAGWYLLELINEILDLAVVESGKLSLSRETVRLVDVLQECRFMIDPIAKKRGILISFSTCDDSWFVKADRTRLKQVLINLLTNAIKYNREHGTVEVGCTASAAGNIRISIKDSGVGLSQEQQARLFHPFDRLGQEAGGEEGTGIGLVVTKQLIEMMEGAIGMESIAGAGSEFWVELIRADIPQAAAVIVKPAEVAPSLTEHTALRTLLHVEDNPANLMLIEHIIEDYPNLRILSAHDGNLGVEIARAHLPDVILMDINLPGMSGIEALNTLRKDPATARIPVIAISANAMPRDIELGVEAGFFSYLTKPFKVNEFIKALDDALKFAGTAKNTGTGPVGEN
jgi:signal transduction histidine kinase/ActR/RegA family two-component response regulator